MTSQRPDSLGSDCSTFDTTLPLSASGHFGEHSVDDPPYSRKTVEPLTGTCVGVATSTVRGCHESTTVEPSGLGTTENRAGRTDSVTLTSTSVTELAVTRADADRL